MVIDRRPGQYLSFPDVCRTASGRLLVAYREADRHVPGRKRLLLRRSEDNGHTWSAPVILNARGGHCPRFSLLDDGGAVIVDDDPGLLYWSMDEGATWASHPPGGLTHGLPDRLLQLDGETLLTTAHANRGTAPQPCIGQPRSEQMAFRSQNRGQNWRPLSVVAADPCLALCEGSVARLDDGRLLCLMRENSRVFEPMYFCLRSEQGATWSEPEPTGLTGHRPCLGLTLSGRLLVTFRNVGPDPGTAAWLGDLDQLREFLVQGLVPDASCLSLDADVMRMRTAGGRQSCAIWTLRPLTDPRSARATLEAELRVNSSGRNGCGLRLGCWFRVEADRIVSESPGARPLKLAPGVAHRIRLEYEPGRVTVRVDGRKRKTYELDVNAPKTRPVLFGNALTREDNEADVEWRGLRLSIHEPRRQRDFVWEWQPGWGLPHRRASEAILELENDREAAWPDFGYSGWVETDQGEFFCVYHHGDGQDENYASGRSSCVKGVWFGESDFSG